MVIYLLTGRRKEHLNRVQERRVRWKVESLKLWVIVKPILDHSSREETHAVPYDNKPAAPWHIPLMKGGKDIDNVSCVIWAKSGIVGRTLL